VKAIRVLLAAGVLLLPTVVSAAPISEVEPPGGLSDNGLMPTMLGSFDVGANTVTGFFQAGTSDDDFWTATVPAGMQITSVDVVQDVSGPQVSTYTFFDGATDDAGAILGFEIVFPFSDPSLLSFQIGAGYPFGPGAYAFWAAGVVVGPTTYVWTVTVESTGIPEPSALVLLAVGAAILASRRRRRAHSDSGAEPR
jgi:hypothetical protein